MEKIIKKNHHQHRNRGLLLLICISFLSPLAQGEVTLDGSVGPAGALTGPDYKITENLGKRAGNNLFHSFGRFNLNASESATFSGSTGIKNVISRVTGGQASNIDGTLRVSIPNANLYLLNPAGVIFGEHAKLDVPGSFHVSTADYLKFQDGGRFDTGSTTAPQILATAEPEAFGFLGDNPSGISLSGSANSVLEVKNSSNLSLIGGDIAIENTALVAGGGQINLVSVGSSGETIVTESGLETTSFDKMGDIRMSHDPLGPLSISSKKVFVRGGQLTINESVIFTESGDHSGIDIGLTGNLSILGIQNNQDPSLIVPGGLYTTTGNEENAGNIVLKVAELKLVQGATINTDTLGSGNGGDLTIKANTISLSENRTSISSEVQSQGDGGDITINVGNKFEILNGARVSTRNAGTGKSGNLTIKAKTLVLSGGNADTGISNEVQKQGDGGDLTINVEDKFEILNGAQVSSANGGTGNSGNLTITANTISLSGGGDGRTGISSVVASQGYGSDVTINVEDKFEILNGANVRTDNNSTDKSKSGNLTINANTLSLSGRGDERTGISGVVKSHGDGSNVTINVEDKFEILDGASVNTSNMGTSTSASGDTVINAESILISAEKKHDSTGIFTSGFGTGNPGNLAINTTKSLKILNGGHIQAGTDGAAMGGNANINSESILLSGKDVSIFGATTSAATGNASKLTLKATKSLELNNGALIVTDTNGNGQAGDLLIEAGNLKISDGHIRSRSRPNSVKANNNVGNAGKITIDVAGKIELSDNALISTSTSGTSQGGDLILTANDIFLDDSRLEATSKSRDINVFRDPNVAMAGNIIITPTSSLRLINDSSISVETEAANAGDITINKGNILQLSDSKISTSVQGGEGNGGNIFITTPIVALDRSDIVARAAKGKGGNITISGFLFQSPSSVVSASSELGIDGNIDFKPDTNISGSLAVLPDTFLNVSQQMSERCVARSGNNLSSFVVKGRSGVPLSPGDLVPSNFMDYLQTEEYSLQSKTSESVTHYVLGKDHQASVNVDCSP